MQNQTQPLAGRYELGTLLGHGGMAQVHRAWDTVLERSVAVKILRHTPAWCRSTTPASRTTSRTW